MIEFSKTENDELKKIERTPYGDKETIYVKDFLIAQKAQIAQDILNAQSALAEVEELLYECEKLNVLTLEEQVALNTEEDTEDI